MGKLVEHVYGSHIYMKMKMDSGVIEEIDVYVSENGTTYKTTKDQDATKRQEIITNFYLLF